MKLPASFRQILSTSLISNETEFSKVNLKVKTKSREKFKKWHIFYIMNKKNNHLERRNIVLVEINDNIISGNEIVIDLP
jgi:hypothetical protein